MRTTPASQELRQKYTSLTEQRRDSENKLDRARDALTDIEKRFPDDKERLDQAKADVAYLRDHCRNLDEQANIVWKEWAKEAEFKSE